MFKFEVILSMKNGDKIRFEEIANNEKEILENLICKIDCTNRAYMTIRKDIDGDCIWIKDTKDIQHIVIREV